MYKKRYNNFSHNYSINNSTKKKQEARFMRCCTRVYNKKNKLRALNDLQKLRSAVRRGFLTSPSQYIDKPKLPPIRRTNYITYNYSSSYNHVPRSQNASSLYIESVALATTFCKDIIYPLPPDMDPVPDNIDIPNELRPYIPDGPIYILDHEPSKKNKNKKKPKKIKPPTYTYCLPGSRLWFDYLEKNIKNDSTSVNDFTLLNENNIQPNNDLSILQQNIMENNKRQWDVVNTQLDNIFIQDPESLDKKRKRSSTSYHDDSLEEGSTSARY
ncbi:unnamed protein product [Rhizophagus irregularis]|uniref:DUF8211 domain-containing protein n=1 Tax=Rhizophagus irregularis TaxID=588596 RepID=A0A916E0L2_9GLOM|nr:unnamed protein product [Rhizophagus irregularis]